MSSTGPGKRLLAFVVPFTVVFGLGMVGWAFTRGAEVARGEPVLTTVDDLEIDTPFVRVRGVAHYGALVKQRVPPRFPWQEERIYFLFPLFSEDAALDRAIRVFVRTPREPDRLVHYEEMVLEGRLVPPTADRIPFNTEISLGQHTEYYFTDDLVVLEPWRIEAEDEVWELPEE